MSSAEVRAELARIAAEHDGLLFPAHVVEAAQPEDSPIHDRFEWDDSEAGIRYRMWQARQLIRVHVVVGPEPGVEPVRAYVSLSTDRIAAGGYRAIVDIRSSDELYQVMLRDAIDELERMRRKYESIRELRPVFRAVDRVASKHKPAAARATA